MLTSSMTELGDLSCQTGKDLKHLWDRNLSLSGTCICRERPSLGQYYRCARCRQAVHKDCVSKYTSHACKPLYHKLILGADVDDAQPLLVFVSSKSGGGQGKALIDKLRALLSEEQVFDLFGDKSNSMRFSHNERTNQTGNPVGAVH
jgi:hypothetical protein